MTEKVGGEGDRNDDLPPMPTDFVVESSLEDSGGKKKKLSIVRRSDPGLPLTESDEQNKEETVEPVLRTVSSSAVPMNTVMAKPIKLRRSKASSSNKAEAKKKPDVHQESGATVSTQPTNAAVAPAKKEEESGDKDSGDIQLVQPIPVNSDSKFVYSSEQLLSLQNDGDKVSTEVAMKLCEVAWPHCESPYLKSSAPYIPTDEGVVKKYTIDEMLAIHKDCLDYRPDLPRLRLIGGRGGAGGHGGRPFEKWETPKVVKDDELGVLVTVEDESFSMSCMSQATKAMERTLGDDDVATRDEHANDVFVVFPKKDKRPKAVEEEEPPKTVVEEDETDLPKMPDDLSDINDLQGDSWNSSSSFQNDADSSVVSDPLGIFKRQPLPDIQSILPDNSSVFGSSMGLDSAYRPFGDFASSMPPPMDMPSMPEEITVMEVSSSQEKQQEEFPPMPDADVEIMSEPDTNDKQVQEEEDEAFPAMPDDTVIAGEDSEVLLVPETPEEEEKHTEEKVTKEEEAPAPAPAVPAPEKTPKKRVLTPQERRARKEEKERKARELKALRYFAQADPGSFPISQAMKADTGDDEDDTDDVNVQVGIDVNSLYDGKIATPVRHSPSRRGHENPSRYHNSRSPNNSHYMATNNRRPEVRPGAADFPPLGSNPSDVTPVELTEQTVVVQVEEHIPEPEPEPVVVNNKPPVQVQPVMDDDEMTAFFMQ